jgi:hypothetical protein
MRFNHVPAWGFGTAKKLEIEKTDPLFNPGPGNYAPRLYKEGPTWRIGSALRISKNRNNNPVPDNIIYQIKFLMVQNIQWRQKPVPLTPQNLHMFPDLVNIILI